MAAIIDSIVNVQIIHTDRYMPKFAQDSLKSEENELSKFLISFGLGGQETKILCSENFISNSVTGEQFDFNRINFQSMLKIICYLVKEQEDRNLKTGEKTPNKYLYFYTRRINHIMKIALERHLSLFDQGFVLVLSATHAKNCSK